MADEKEEPKQTLTQAIEKAETEVSEAEPQVLKEDKKEEKEKDESDGLSDLEQKQAREIFKALKDPERAPALIEFIAKQAGYDKVETKREAQEAKDSILETLKESLGPEFEFLTSRLSPAITKILDEKLAEHTRDIRQSIYQEKEEKIRVETTAGFTELAQSYFGKDVMPNNLMSKMGELMEIYPPSHNVTVKDYLKDIMFSAAARINLDLKTIRNQKNNSSIVERNRTDAVSRLASERGVTNSQVVGASHNQKMSLTDSIKKAMEEVEIET